MNNIWLVTFIQYDRDFFDHETCRLKSAGNLFAAKLLPMSPVQTVTHVTGMDREKLAEREGFEPSMGF